MTGGTDDTLEQVNRLIKDLQNGLQDLSPSLKQIFLEFILYHVHLSFSTWHLQYTFIFTELSQQTSGEGNKKNRILIDWLIPKPNYCMCEIKDLNQ